jgi:hypothetical protein
MKSTSYLVFFATGAICLTAATAQTEKAALVASDGSPFDNYGRAVAIAGDYAAVGAPNHNLPVSQCGAVYTYQNVAGTWVFDTKLQAASPASGDLFGFALSMDDGRLAVGVRHDDQVASDAGAVAIYRRDPGGWVLEQKLVPGNTQAQQVFGCSVSLSGDRVAIGAVGIGAGATYVFVRSGTTWTQEALIFAPTSGNVGLFGERVSMSGDRIAIGARSTNQPFTHTGAAFTYTRSGSTWSLETSFTSPNAQPSGEFGGAVALAGAALMIGASNENSATTGGGRVYAYTLSGGVWSLQQTLVPATIADNDRFGWSIAMVRGYAVIGSLFRDFNGMDSGAAFVWQASGGVWSQTSEFAGSTTVTFDTFGSAVAIGDRHFLVGAESKNSSQGAAYLFQR